jgi:hypothetical protein
MKPKVPSDAIYTESDDSKPRTGLIAWLLEPVDASYLPEGVLKIDEFGKPLRRSEIAEKECWNLRSEWARCELSRTWFQSCRKKYDVYNECLKNFLSVSHEPM